MAASGIEIRPRRITPDSIILSYHVIDAPTVASLYTWVESLPGSVETYPYSTFQADEIEGCENADEYFVTVTYGTSDSPTAEQEPGTAGYRFSYQAPSAKITHSLATISVDGDGSYWFPGPFPDFQGAINVADYGTPDMKVEGIDLSPPAEVFTIPYSDVDATITLAYQALVRNLCGKVNSVEFYGYLAGQIMLVRVDGQYQNGLWNLEFGFAYIANDTNIPVGDNITVLAKDGMDLLWVLYSPTNQGGGVGVATIPTVAYVERVWERADLTTLNLPGIP